MRVILWTLGLIGGGLLIFAAFTKACDLITAPSNFKVVVGLTIFAIIAGAAIAAIFTALRHLAARMRPPIEVVHSGADDAARRVHPD